MSLPQKACLESGSFQIRARSKARSFTFSLHFASFFALKAVSQALTTRSLHCFEGENFSIFIVGSVSLTTFHLYNCDLFFIFFKYQHRGSNKLKHHSHASQCSRNANVMLVKMTSHRHLCRQRFSDHVKAVRL